MTANLTGVNVASLTGAAAAATSSLAALGSTIVSVYLSASGTDTYKAGTYMAQVTVTCAVN